MQLAVVAHVRHVHTPYDFLLKAEDWVTARDIVLPQVIDRLKMWRDDFQQDFAEIEEIFQEVIVLDDDEGEDGRGIPQASTVDNSSTAPKSMANKTKSVIPQARQKRRSPSIEFVREQPAAVDYNLARNNQHHQEPRLLDHFNQAEQWISGQSVYPTVERQPDENSRHEWYNGATRRQWPRTRSISPELPGGPKKKALAERRRNRSPLRPHGSAAGVPSTDDLVHPSRAPHVTRPLASWPHEPIRQGPAHDFGIPENTGHIMPHPFAPDMATGGLALRYPMHNPPSQPEHRAAPEQQIPQQGIWHSNQFPVDPFQRIQHHPLQSTGLPNNGYNGFPLNHGQNSRKKKAPGPSLTRSGLVFRNR